MKRALVALAALGAFVNAAQAQSSVTLYGRLEASVAYIMLGDGSHVTALSNGTNGTVGADPIGGSRWGLRGSEDLGSGLKANFVLESGFFVDSGGQADSARLFNRQAYVALQSAALGEIRLGRQQGLTRELDVAIADITGEGELTVIDTTGFGASRPLFQNFGTRVDNAAQYISPSFSGFQGRLLIAAGERVGARQEGLMLSYMAGPLKLGATYEQYNGFTTSGRYNKVGTVAASYNLGVATLAAAYQKTSDFGTSTAATFLTGGATRTIDHDAYNIGVLIPFGGAFEFRAQYTHSTVERASGGDQDQYKYGASLRYNLSKRTTIYTVAHKRDGDGEVTGTNRETVVAFGMAHQF